MTEEKSGDTGKAEVLPNEAGESISKPLVLVAEDQLVNQKLILMLLDNLGYSSVLASDGLETLEKAEQCDPVLILMDIQMPKMNGYEAAENLRKRGFRKPIIAVTAGITPGEFMLCQKAGINDVLIKPLKLADIEKILLKWTGLEVDVSEASFRPDPKTDLGFGISPDSGSGIPGKKPGDSAPAVVFDSSEMLDAFLNEIELILPLLARFINRTQGQLDNILVLKENENWEDAFREVHTIKGASNTLGGKELGKAASRLELAFKNIDRDEIEAAYPPVLEAFLRFKKEAEDFLRERG